MSIIDNKKKFFNYILNRQLVWWNRFNEKKEFPWTEDPILQKYKFCNVFRELDVGTKIILDKVINTKIGIYNKLFNIIAYRFFNHRNFYDIVPVLDYTNFDYQMFYNRMTESYNTYGKIFSSAYIITQARVYRDTNIKGKLYQVCRALNDIKDIIPEIFDKISEASDSSYIMKTISSLPLVGPFLGYQIILDMIYTGSMSITEDWHLYVGPGAFPGLSLIYEEDDISDTKSYDLVSELHEEQNEYLDSRFRDIIPYDKIWNKDRDMIISWNNIEFNLCEFRKYNNCIIKKGRLRHYDPEYS